MRRKILLFGGLLLAVVIVALPFLRNPERKPLTEADRVGVGGAFLRLQQGVVHYEVAGPEDGRPVVLIHGFSVPAYLWDGTFATLAAAGFRVLRYDLYGRGYSDRPPGPYDLSFYEDQLLELLTALGWQPPVDVVGISLGGVIAAAFTRDHPEWVRRVVLMDPFTLSRDTAPFVVPVLGEYLTYAALLPMLPAMQVADFADPARMPPGWLERYRQQLRYRGLGRALLATIRHVLRQDAVPVYEAMAVHKRPVLLIWGEDDRTVPFAESELVRRALGDTVDFLPVPNAGHLPHIEQPDIVHPRLIAFLRR
jgi:pimeloyl-ACP methyl ester carboxylesterase